MKTKITIMAVVAAATLSACSNNENEGITDGGRNTATFSASISGQTRAYDQTWEARDAIGITGTSGDKAYTNVQYTTPNADGNFTVGTPGTEIYYQDDAPVTFTAYYPWSDLQDNTSMAADTWQQAEQKKFDFLWAQASGSKASPNVAFSFSHKMAKVVLTVKCGADVDYEEVKAAVLTLDGFKHEGSFNVTTGTAEATGNKSVMWLFAGNAEADAKNNAPFRNDDEKQTVSYTLIFFPQTFDAALPFTAELTGRQSFTADLDFTAANAKIDKDGAKNEWVAGRQYNMSVTLHKTGITVNGCTIAPWNEAEAGNVDAH